MTQQKKKHNLTLQILTGMGLGVIVGLLGNFLIEGNEGALAGALWQFGVDGLFKLAGAAFMALLQVLVVPLVFISLVCGTAALDDVRKLGRIGARTVFLYLATTAIAISLALAASVVIGPGRGFGLSTEANFEATAPPSLTEVLIGIFPKNILEAMSSGNMLQIIVFAILFGLALTLSGNPGQRLLAVFNDLNEAIMKLVWIVMRIAPFGVFGLIARTFATQGFDAFAPLLKYFSLILGVLFFHALTTYPLLIRVLAGLNPFRFISKLRDVQIFAFSTASSNATIPVTLNTLENNLGVKNSVASFTVPLGATINMDGTAIMQGVATVFIAQAYGMGLDLTDYLMVVITATLASIGTAGVPGVGLIMLSMVLTQVGLPVEGIGLIIGIDRLLDMVRTAVNVTGDCAVSCIVARAEGELDTGLYDTPRTLQPEA
ncbi:MAG: dicarboxylate/amino acid:cation symporter [Opitutales bacterium]|jgi:Na+/H+-dicarboxylate symporter